MRGDNLLLHCYWNHALPNYLNIHNQVYLEKHSIDVETVSLFIKKFEGIDLDFGKYTIYLRTLYNEDVEDIFVKEFEIRSKISKSKRQLFDIKFELDRKKIEKA